MRYNRRAIHVLSELNFNALIYIMPESDEPLIENDWIAEMMVEAALEMRSVFIGSVVLIAPFKDVTLADDIM